MPEISIIIPVYNAETTLKLCVDSILSQLFKDFELLLIDDGSKDNSPAFCDLYAKTDSRVRVFHKQNGGVSAARNLGLEHAEGKWITFIDSDDYIEPNYLDYLKDDTDLYIKTMKTFRGTNTKLYTVCGIQDKTRLTGNNLETYIKNNVSGFIFRAPWGKFYKRDIIGDLRFKEDMKVAEDSCFVINFLSRINSLTLMPKGAYVVRLSTSPANVKYALTVAYAANSLEHLHKAYILVNDKFHIGTKGFYPYIGSFKDMSKAEWSKAPGLWYKNATVKQVYKYIWKELSCKEKFRLIAAFIIRK